MGKKKDIAAYRMAGHFIPTAGIWQGDLGLRGKDPRFYDGGRNIESSIPTLGWGERLTEEEAARLMNPVLMQGTTQSRKMPRDLAAVADMFHLYNPIVSEKMMLFVESLEPGIHQFFEVGIQSTHTGARVYENTNWYYWNIMHWIAPDRLFDTSHALRSDFDVVTNGTRLVNFFHSTFKMRQVFKREATNFLSDYTFWKCSSYKSGNARYLNPAFNVYCKPHVKDVARSAGLRGLHFFEIEWAAE